MINFGQAHEYLPSCRASLPIGQYQAAAYSPTYTAAWNSLPPDICASASPAMLKKLLKMHFFHIAFSIR